MSSPTPADSPEPTHSYAKRADEIVLETGKTPAYSNTYPGYLVQAHDLDGRLLWDGAGRPVLVPQDRQGAEHPLDRMIGWALVLLFLILVAVCVIGGIGLHYLDELVNPSLF